MSAETVLPYCGAPPAVGTLAERWNLDPMLLAALAILALVALLRAPAGRRPLAAAGWTVAALALMSPLCALSVSLFAARVSQHMLLAVIAAPLIAAAMPAPRSDHGLWPATFAFFVALWFWHMPVPYDATFHSTVIYWAMHISLFGTAICLWRALLGHRPHHGLRALAAGTVTALQMSLLGAVLTFASYPMFPWHFATTAEWGLTPLADQQLGGVVMWVPGCLLLLWAGLRSTRGLASAMKA
ncbi:cytochrome c oxidase assembly protein [Sphingomonas quercus]|uniref:Cytochrome c oxidase assembly protein n=1 Tax=Sphingomonas quercus TaxID=2842451 RepID=A0ABS6BM22_9SPHN|nr:cytochrome c oxidase assembly protein [Sphingomonas quercus]MBU3079353.1 cytochrome c oxidase assembly protein [Sphingomonas quercus]